MARSFRTSNNVLKVVAASRTVGSLAENVQYLHHYDPMCKGTNFLVFLELWTMLRRIRSTSRVAQEEDHGIIMTAALNFLRKSRGAGGQR